LEFADENLTEISVENLGDTGAEVDMAVASLVDEIESLGLASRYKLRQPIDVGSIDSPTPVFRVTHAVRLPQRIGDEFFEWTYGVADIPGPPHIILGKNWIEHHLPSVVHSLKNFGQNTIGKPRDYPLKGLSTPVVTTALAPARSDKPIPFGPAPGLQTPLLTGGGDFKALSPAQRAHEALLAHDHDQEHLTACFRATYVLKEAVEVALDDKKYARRLARAARAGIPADKVPDHADDSGYESEDDPLPPLPGRPDLPGDPGVRGLTANREGWFESIPEPFREFADSVFSDEAINSLPPPRPGYDCRITLKDGARLTVAKLYDMSQKELEVLEQLIKHELNLGFIRPSHAAHSAPVFFVRDPPSDSRNQGQLRLVVDYRRLNDVIEPDAYPLPLIRSVQDRLLRAKVATVFDVASGFRNIRMDDASAHLAAFTTPMGLFEPTVMPMGLATAPAIFQRFINSLLQPVSHFTFAYLDDILVYSNSEEEHREHVRQVLEILRASNLHLKPHKCKWFCTSVSFLGFVFDLGKGMRMADDKIQGIRDLRPPRNLADLRTLLGKMGWVSGVMPDYADVTACLTDLQKKDVPWVWTDRHEAAFQRLKYCLCAQVYLRPFDPSKPIRGASDASDAAFGGFLEQEYDDGWHPFLMYSHKFKDGEKGWDVPDKELYAIVYAFTRYRSFLAQPAHEIEWYTDHRNLAKFMLSSDLLRSHLGRLGRWWLTLSQARVRIMYTPGETNLIPDFLSRYGYPASVDHPPRVLLPLSRFSTKAQVDIKKWFKKHAHEKNIAQILEEQFADVPDELPVSEPPLRPRCSHECPSVDFSGHCQVCGPECRMHPRHAAWCVKNNGSGFPNPTPSAPTPGPSVKAASGSWTPPPRERLVPSSLSPRQTRLAASLGLARYAGTKLDFVLPNLAACRIGANKLGLGAAASAAAGPAPLVGPRRVTFVAASN
jgi:hypothetical protein